MDNGLTGGWMGGWMDRRMDGQIGRQNTNGIAEMGREGHQGSRGNDKARRNLEIMSRNQ